MNAVKTANKAYNKFVLFAVRWFKALKRFSKKKISKYVDMKKHRIKL